MAKGYKTWILDRRNDVVLARVKLGRLASTVNEV